MSLEKLIRKELLAFGGYAAAASPETLTDKIGIATEDIIKLDANENPYGASPRVQKALADFDRYHIYPDDGQENLRRQLADFTGTDMKYIVAGSGSNQLIDLLVRLLVDKDDEVINITPTFGIYSFSTRLAGGKLVEVPRHDDFSLNMAAIRSVINKQTKLIFIANPNNPTGNPAKEDEILSLLQTGIPVVVDEAYYEFSQATVLPLLEKFDNLIILRTFSKWAGLAGLRVGYGFFPPAVADFLLRIKIPYNVNVAAQVAVAESIKDIDYLMSSVHLMIEERERLFTKLQEFSWLSPYPSKANFILCRVQKITAKELYRKLQEQGILVRYFDQPRIQDCIRFSVGKPFHTEVLLKALLKIGGK